MSIKKLSERKNGNYPNALPLKMKIVQEKFPVYRGKNCVLPIRILCVIHGPIIICYFFCAVVYVWTIAWGHFKMHV